MDRGAAGVSFGILKKLEIREGDVLIHNVAPANFRKNWLSWTGLPAYHLMELYEPDDFWKINEWSLADKLEQSSAIPHNFYAHHDAYTMGLTRWWAHLVVLEIPKKKIPRHHTTHRKIEAIEKRKNKPGKKNKDYFSAKNISFSQDQINIKGIQRYREVAAEKNVQLILLYLPGSKTYREETLHPKLTEAWNIWSKGQAEFEYFPPLKEMEYYDSKHPNFKGRKIYSRLLVDRIIRLEGG